jgi:hypothetical protein
MSTDRSKRPVIEWDENGQHFTAHAGKDTELIGVRLLSESEGEALHYVHSLDRWILIHREPESDYGDREEFDCVRAISEPAAMDWVRKYAPHHRWPKPVLGLLVKTVLAHSGVKFNHDGATLQAPSADRDGNTVAIYYLGDRAYRVGDDKDEFTVADRDDCVLQAFINRPALDSQSLADRSGLKQEAIPGVIRHIRTRYGRRFYSAVTTPGRKGNGGYKAKVIEAIRSQR